MNTNYYQHKRPSIHILTNEQTNKLILSNNMNIYENSSCSNNINTDGYNNNEQIVPLQAIDMVHHNNADECIIPTSIVTSDGKNEVNDEHLPTSIVTSDGKNEVLYLKTIFSSRKTKRRISKISARSSASGNDVIDSYNMKSSHTNSGGDGDNMILSSSNGRTSKDPYPNPNPDTDLNSPVNLDIQQKRKLLNALKIVKAVRAAQKKHKAQKTVLAKAIESINKRERCLIQSMALAKAIKREAESMVRKEAKEQQEMRQEELQRQENVLSSSSL